MMPCGPLADDWLFWDPETIFAYPHSREPGATPSGTRELPNDSGEPLQLELFEAHPEGPPTGP